MATTPTTRVTALARRMRVDIDTATYPTVNYQQLMGIEELKLVEELRTEGDETYEDEGAMREAVTGYAWRIEAKIKHSTNAAGTSIDTVHAFLRTMFNLAKVSNVAQAEFGVRWYDRNGLSGDSFEGRAYVKAWPHDGGNSGSLDTVSVVIQGQGPLVSITNPVANPDPAVSAVSPTSGATAGGELVNIYGINFTGATDVDFGATAADDFTVVSDSHIVALTPAVAASTVQVAVTTAEGTSADTAADNFTFA